MARNILWSSLTFIILHSAVFVSCDHLEPSNGCFVGVTPSDDAMSSGDFVGYETSHLGFAPAAYVQFFDLPIIENDTYLHDFLYQVGLKS